MMKPVCYACDVGSTKSKGFGWARFELDDGSQPIGSSEIDQLTHKLREDMSTGRSVALGFEAPLYMPVPEESRALSSGREDEGNRSMFAPAGAYVTTLACHQAAFLLNALKDFQRTYQLTLHHDEWIGTRHPTLLLWEAFVSGDAKKKGESDGNSDHVHDAATAANFFRGNRARLSEFNDVTCDRPLSVIGAVALWSGWSSAVVPCGSWAHASRRA